MRLAPLLALFCPAATVAGDFDPAWVDIVSLVECKANVPDYNGFALWLVGQPGAAGTLGWKAVPSENPFLRQYQLPGPLHVFGHETNAIVFTATGPMALLEGVAAPELARKLDVPEMVAERQTSSSARRSSLTVRRLTTASLSPRVSHSTCRWSIHTQARRWRAVPMPSR